MKNNFPYFTDRTQQDIDIISQEKQKFHKNNFENTNMLLDKIDFVFQKHLSFLNFARHNERHYDSLIYTALHKNFYIIYSANDLLKKGLYGSSLVLLRQSFEFLMISKFCAISKDYNLYNQWENGKHINMKNLILNKIKKPNVEKLNDFWKYLCNVNHSSIYSQQVDLIWKNQIDSINSTFIYIRILLEWHYHLLNSIYLTKKIKYYFEYYDDKNIMKKCKLDITNLFKLTKKNYSKEAKSLVWIYKASWEITPNKY